MIIMKKNKIIISILSIVIILLILGVSYAAYSYTQNIGTGKVTTGAIDVKYSEQKNQLTLSKKVPLYDNEGKVLEETLDFSVDTKVSGDFVISYIVTVEKIEALSNIDEKYIKVYLEKSSDGINYQQVSDAKIFEGIEEESSFGAPEGSMIIDSGIVTETTKYYYRLRIWLDGSYSENNVSKDFAVKTNVYSTTEKETLDSNKPVCSFKNINDIKVSKESIITLECIDKTSGVVEKELNISDIELSSNNIEIKSIEKEKITNGIRYNIRVKGLTTGSTTIKLNSGIIEDTLGNTNIETSKELEVKGLTYNVNYIKDSNIKSISKESDSCTTEGSNLSCSITLPEVELNEGYHLDGYYINNEKIDGNIVTINSDKEVDIRSKINSYTVTYNYSENGGTTSSKTIDTVNYNEEIDLTPTAEKDGYTFIGWNTDKDAHEKIDTLTMKTNDVVLYAIYKKIETATFKYYNDGLKSTTSTCERYNNEKCSFTVPSVVTSSTGMENSTYQGLSTSVSSKTITTTYNTDNLIYYAVYKGSYTATFEIGEGVSSIGSTIKSCDTYKTTDATTYKAESCSITLPSITVKTGYQNGVWDKGNTLTGNTTITASATIIIYTITYNANSGTCTNCTSSTYTSYTVEDEVTLPTPTRSGYTFAGWKLDSSTGLTGDTSTTSTYTKLSKGSTGNRSYTASWKDETPPVCGSFSGESTSWIKSGSRTISVACTDEASGCKQDTYTKEITTDAKTMEVSIDIYDKEENKTTCTSTVNIYRDTKSPEITVSSGSYSMFNTSNVYSNTSDATSGVKSITCKETTRNKNITTYNSIGVIGPQNLSCTIEDNAGNSTTKTSSITTYFDNVGSYGGLGATNGAYKSGNSIYVPNDGIQFGPYVLANKGCYHVWYWGNNLNVYPQGYAAYETSTGNFTISNLNYVSADSNYYVYIPSNLTGNGLETYFRNMSSSVVRVDRIQIAYSGSSC